MRPASTTGVTVALLVALLAGCTSADQGGNPPDQPPASTGPSPTVAATGPSPTITPTGAPTASGVAQRVMLQRSGGFAGRGDAVTVEPDGRWTAVDRAGSRRTGRLDTATLGRLGGLAADPRLAAEARRTAAPSECADAFSYRLTVGTIETGYVDCPSEAAPPPATRALVELILRATD